MFALLARNASLMNARKTLRKELRARRRAVPPQQRRLAARLIAKHVDHAFHLRTGLRVAAFASMSEEVDTGPLLELLRVRGCRIYLPRIARRTGRMTFVESTERFRRNHLGIAEPMGHRYLSAHWLDLVLMPLVGFDAHGNRLGMGGGFYDRAFAFRRWRGAWSRPRLIGIAYDLQRVEAIASEPHDVRIDAVVTEKGVTACTG